MQTSTFSGLARNRYVRSLATTSISTPVAFSAVLACTHTRVLVSITPFLSIHSLVEESCPLYLDCGEYYGAKKSGGLTHLFEVRTPNWQCAHSVSVLTQYTVNELCNFVNVRHPPPH